MQKGHIQIQSGQTLLEALIALAVAGIVIAAAAVITSNSLRTSQTSRSQNLASQLAQEGLELARIKRLPAPAASSPSVTYCIGEEENNSFETPGNCGNVANIGAEFKREVTLYPIDSTTGSSCGANTYKVSSKVYWTDGQCTVKFCRDVELQTCLAP